MDRSTSMGSEISLFETWENTILTGQIPAVRDLEWEGKQ